MSGFVFVLLAMFVFMYLLIIRPQRAQQRRHQELLANLKVGDEVITVGGIYGDVTGVEADRVEVEIAEGVEIEVAKRAIASVVPPEEYEEDEDELLVEAPPAEDGSEPVAATQEDPGRR